ncbi:MAG: chitobiase/beta-hexosaminidase C-terminal domain-containing protein, partial [Prevotella sp.]
MNKMTNIHCRQILRTVIMLLLLLAGSIQSTWADEVIFSMSTKVSSTETVINGGTIAGSTFANVTGGTVTYQNNHTGTAYAAVKNSLFYFGTTHCYFKIELTKPLQTGDKIKFASMPLNVTNKTGVCFCTAALQNKTYYVDNTKAVADIEYEVPQALNGISTLYLFRYQGTGTSFNDMTIVRPTQAIELSSSPSSSLSAGTQYYIDADGNYVTEAPESYLAMYKFTANGDTHGNKGTTITIPNATEGKYTVVLGGCKENTGTYTITSDNAAFETITISDAKTEECYGVDGSTITRTFYVTQETTITIAGDEYTSLPYFSVTQALGCAVNINYSLENAGTVDIDGNLYKKDESVTMTATPNHGYAFKEWRDAAGSSVVSTENPYTFTMGTEDVTYTAVFEALTLYDLTTTVEPVGGGTITNKDTYPSHPEGEQITLTAVPATGYSFKGWKKDGSTVSTELTYSFNMPAEAVAITAVFDKQYSITFGVGESGAAGQVPPVIYVQADNATSFTVPNNNSLYKEGCTLTAWTDGTNTYKLGESVIATSNLTLTPVFTPNTVSLSDLTEETTVTWQFGKSKGAPSLNINTNSTLYLVTQAEVNGILIDVPFYIQTKTGKFANSSRSDEFAQVNSGSVYTIPAFKNASVKLGSYSNKDAEDTKVGTVVVVGPEGSARPYYYTATVKEEDINSDGNIDITIGNDMGGYMSSVSISYPAQKHLSDLKIALGKENITLNLDKSYTLTLDTDYYTSGTGTITYESSIPSVAEVDENGVITPKGYGKTIITLNQEGDSKYASGSIAFTVKVISPEGQTLKPEAEITEDGTVTLTATEGTTIYYTTDGTTPNASSTEYTGPIPMPIGNSHF